MLDRELEFRIIFRAIQSRSQEYIYSILRPEVYLVAVSVPYLVYSSLQCQYRIWFIARCSASTVSGLQLVAVPVPYLVYSSLPCAGTVSGFQLVAVPVPYLVYSSLPCAGTVSGLQLVAMCQYRTEKELTVCLSEDIYTLPEIDIYIYTLPGIYIYIQIFIYI